MTNTEMANKLIGVSKGSKIFVNYKSEKSSIETSKFYMGSLERFFTNKQNETVFTILSSGEYRAFNPTVGQLFGLEVL